MVKSPRETQAEFQTEASLIESVDEILTVFSSGNDLAISRAATSLIKLREQRVPEIAERREELTSWLRHTQHLTPKVTFSRRLGGADQEISLDTQEHVIAALLYATEKWMSKRVISLRDNPQLKRSGLLSKLYDIGSLELLDAVSGLLPLLGSRRLLKRVKLKRWSVDLAAELEELIGRSGLQHVEIEELDHPTLVKLAAYPMTFALFIHEIKHQERCAHALISGPPHTRFQSGLTAYLLDDVRGFYPNRHYLSFYYLMDPERIKACRGFPPRCRYLRHRYELKARRGHRPSEELFIAALLHASGRWRSEVSLQISGGSKLFETALIQDLNHLTRLSLVGLNADEINALRGLEGLKELEVNSVGLDALSALSSLIKRCPQLQSVTPQRLSSEVIEALSCSEALQSVLRRQHKRQHQLDWDWAEAHRAVSHIGELLKSVTDAEVFSQACELLCTVEGLERSFEGLFGHLLDDCDALHLVAGAKMRASLSVTLDETQMSALVALLMRAAGRFKEGVHLSLGDRLNPHLLELDVYEEFADVEEFRVSAHLCGEHLLRDLAQTPRFAARLERESRDTPSVEQLRPYCVAALKRLTLTESVREMLIEWGSRHLSKLGITLGHKSRSLLNLISPEPNYMFHRCLTSPASQSPVSSEGASERQAELWVGIGVISRSHWRESWNDRDQPLYTNWEMGARFCNKLSARHQLTPAYLFPESGDPEVDLNASGYRMLFEDEWIQVAPALMEVIERARALSHQRYFYEREHHQMCLLMDLESSDDPKTRWSDDRSRSQAHHDLPGFGKLEWCNDLWLGDDLIGRERSPDRFGRVSSQRRVCRGTSSPLESETSSLTSRSGHRVDVESEQFSFRICRRV